MAGLEKSVEDLEREILCTICKCDYTDPKILPCYHYYCKQCIYELALRTGLDHPFTCPECRRDTVLPQGNVDNLPTAFFVNRLKEVHSKLKQAGSQTDAKCDMCSSAVVKAFCQHCAQYICDKCINAHQRMKIFYGHKIISLQEVAHVGKIAAGGISGPPRTCEIHEEPLRIYCYDCKCLICRDCMARDHSGHNHEFIKVAAAEMKNRLMQHLKPLEDIKIRLAGLLEDLQETKSEIECQTCSLNNNIEISFKELSEILENHKQKLLNEVSKKAAQKLEQICFQERMLSTSSIVITNVIEYAKQCVVNSADDEVMYMHGEIQNRIDMEIHHQSEERLDLEPVEVNMGVEMIPADDLQQLCQTKAKIVQLSIDPTKCSAVGEGIKTAEVDKVSQFYLKTKLSNGKRSKLAKHVDCYLKSLVNGSTIQCRQDIMGNGEYHVEYQPFLRGLHKLIVTINGQEIAGSPFLVTVSIPPNCISKPIKVFTHLCTPHSVAINSLGEVIVTEWEGNVVVMDRNGKKLKTIKLDHKNGRLTGVVIDAEDNIYVADKNNRIIKFTSKMKFVKEVTVKVAKMNLFGITIVGDEVMVVDKKMNSIFVYTTELEYSRQIDSLSVGNKRGIFDLSSDEHGNLYISHCGNSHIQVLSKYGKFLTSFGFFKGNGKPAGICVACNHVYVADESNHKIFIYTIDGKYISSFGKWGTNEGELYGPCGVCVDNDGFVYVCDKFNNRLQLF